MEAGEGHKAIKTKTTTRGIRVVTLHYSAHPHRNQKWADAKKPFYDQDKWNQEQEISYDVTPGQPVLKVEPLIHFAHLKPLSAKPFWRGWDFGYRAPACIVTQMNLKDQWCWLWGMVGENIGNKRFFKQVFEMCDAKFPQPKDDEGRPMEQLWIDFCDPQVREVKRGSETSDEEDLHVAYQEHYRKDMDLNWRKRSFETGIGLIRERLELRNDGNPGLLIHDEFEDAKDATLGGYHFPEDRRSGAKNEYPADDGYFIHMMDAARYIANCRFESAEARVEIEHEKWPEPWNENINRGGLVMVR